MTCQDSSSLNGNSPNIFTRQIQIGHALFAPLTDNILRTYHQKPQITVSINGLVSKCSNSCDFEWSNESTPIVESIAEQNSSLVTLMGYGFDLNPENNLVLIGETNCDVVWASENRLECVPEKGPLGSFSFSVNVFGKGLASLTALAANATYTFELDAYSVSPSTSGTGGGVIVNITGKGFSTNTKVSIDGINCAILAKSYQIISCIVPSNPTNISKSVNILISDNDQNKTLENLFFYDYDNTPYVSGISKTKLRVVGEETITINKTFTEENIQVYIGSNLAKILWSTNDSIVIQTPPNKPGFYPLIIPVNSYGNANLKMELNKFWNKKNRTIIANLCFILTQFSLDKRFFFEKFSDSKTHCLKADLYFDVLCIK
ncbi:fibrocystin-L-like isoform X1 [Brachionus plicatilis]|uniref:Fibrocystin-L-like isoform X1 n=1 Tax=Brachionus plicatilis TaxID=10195 RepID=A0A3M7P9C5_BRAPC|nr:fibrocystin-L-like isoform X1 [Brachionus plicatilis]